MAAFSFGASPQVHGGDLGDAAALGGRAPWLDLSTGINPTPYPATPSTAALTLLPQQRALKDTLLAARSAYAVPSLAAIMAAPGTQAILQWLPIVAPSRTVAILGPTYAEHETLWRRAGATVRIVGDLEAAAEADCVVVVNPNNPDGRLIAADRLAAFASERSDRRVIVDEAFCDLCPEASVAGAPGTLVLRSFGKFFGLAGVRLGFAIGEPAVVSALTQAMGPWAVSGPALQIGAQALADEEWTEATRARLRKERAALDGILAAAGLSVIGGTDL
ncbi:MAG: aminotransferase class I/II-fold pyridoxal phosphate-dependent enzyme, partial [Pseudomonadota bacterium]